MLEHVHRSMKNDLPLQTSISKLSGYVKNGTCTCVGCALERCCHIAALMTFILEYVKEKGSIANKPSTSLPCTWNLGKKRKKDPKPLHMALYNSTNRRSSSKMYSWDPRPEKYRDIDMTCANNFVRDMQLASNSEPSMWETILKFKYDDYELDDNDIQILKAQIDIFE